MRWIPVMPNWRWLGRRATARAHAVDPADLGTAFGLEACLEEGGEFHRPPETPFPLESEQRASRRPGDPGHGGRVGR